MIMNKKIFTLLVGAGLLVGSSITVNAQNPNPYLDKQTSTTGVQTTDFSDILTADTVKKLPKDNKNYYYLLSVTGLANPSGSAAATALGAKINGTNKSSVEQSYVMFVDEKNGTKGSEEMYLRIENLADLDSAYSYTYQNTAKSGTDYASSKFGTLRRVSWCLDYQQLDVNGSNIVYDFTNMATGRALEAPMNYDNPSAWGLDASGNQVYDASINTYDPDLIVNGWHFSQSYVSTQNLQTGMPLYSYIKTDSVAVLVLRDTAYINHTSIPSGKVGGFTVTVKNVAVNDLIKDAAGNVRIGGANAVSDVLLFTLKKVNKFVLNANDWNSINNKITFDLDATLNVKNKAKGNTYTNPFNTKDKYLRAYEVNDSLYHYGYMQFQQEGTTNGANYLYVDTAWVNEGNDQYLAFGLSTRRDSTLESNSVNVNPAQNSILWGDSYKHRDGTYGKKPALYGDYFCDVTGTYVPYQAFLMYDSVIPMTAANWPAAWGGQQAWWDANSTIRYSFVYTLAGAAIATPSSLPTAPDATWTLTCASTGQTVGNNNYYASTYYSDSIQWRADSVNYIYAFMKDSIMENQSKFRVVYDPYADSTFINVYQTRVAHPDYTKGAQNATWPYWWENSFGSKLNGYLGDIYVTRPSDGHTHLMYGGYSYDGVTPTLTITEAALSYYTSHVLTVPSAAAHVSTLLPYRASDRVSTVPYAGFYSVEGHGQVAPNRNNDGSLMNLHSFMEYYPQSMHPYMDKVMISTADTCPIFAEYQTNVSALSHMYGWSLTTGNGAIGNTSSNEPKYRDSLFYVDLQNLNNAANRIITLDQTYKDGKMNLDTRISLWYGDRCTSTADLDKATIPNGLYLIRNTLGQYLNISLQSTMDSVSWRVPENNEDPTKMPSFQWAVINVRNTEHSPFRLINREFERVEYPYVYVYENQAAPFQLTGAYANAKFNTKNVTSGVIKDSVNWGSIDPNDFVSILEAKYPNEKFTFLRLAKDVKEKQLLGYKYIDRDSTILDVYAFKYLHHTTKQPGDVPTYLSWNGYQKGSTDTALYATARDYYDKLYFNLQEMTAEDIRPVDKYGNGQVTLTSANTAAGKANADFAGLYNEFANRYNQYSNHDSIVLERFGFYENNTGIPYLKPLARQAYRLFLQDYYRWHPTISGHYVTVGEQERYVLADKANALRKYVKGSGNVTGLFGIPHFYFRETFFDVVSQKGNDFFALVQRLDTARVSDQNYYEWGVPSYGDLQDYMTLKYGSTAGGKVLDQVKRSNELGFALLSIEDVTARAMFTLRGDKALNTSAFQLERDDDPIYRRFHVNEPSGNFGGPLNGTDIPDTLEFHLLNQDLVGYRLYENAGNYTDADQSDRFGTDGGRIYNRYNNGAGDYYRDTINNVISFLGMNNSAQYKSTNYSIFVDTAFINRGTGWIKPQYMLVVDPYNPYESGDCDPNTGDKDSPNGNYVVGRYMYNTSMYAKAVKDSVLNSNYAWEYANKTYTVADVKNTLLYKTDNFSKVEPIQTKVLRKPNGASYTHEGDWERFAFTWAIHKGDSLYVLKGAEPAYGGTTINDPKALWQKLCAEYGGGGKGDYIDFQKLINDNTASTYREAYYPLGDRGGVESRLFRTFDSYAQVLKEGRTIGLQAIIALDDNTHKDWVFSFRYIERDADDFVIESETTDRDTRNGAIIRPGYGGWLKSQNGVPTITRSDEKLVMGEAQGAVFNVARVSTPVSNEGVDAVTSNVKVVAGTGSVSILNAAGKTVVISNMLGQIIANTTVSSDNASIAVPAGVAVVMVEGESAVKALVK